MKYLLFTILTISFLFNSNYSAAQDCNSLIKEDKYKNDLHILQSVPLRIVDRGQARHSIEFLHNENGILAKVHSKSDLEFYPNDEIFFKNSDGDIKKFKYTDLGKQTNQNFFVLDLATIKWFSTGTVNTVYFKSNTQNTMYKYSLDSRQQSGLKNLATCFALKLD